MASIFYDTTGSFSALTPKKIVASVWTLTTSISSFVGSATNTARFVPFTPSELGDCEGVMLGFRVTQSATQTAVVSLQQALGTFTVTVASPAVFTLSSHGMSDGDQVTLATTGALPTGLNATTKYFVINSTTHTFNLSLTSGGSAINTTGTQSGTHTLWHDKRDVTQAYDAYIGAEHLAEFTGKATCVFRYIAWSSAYAITADANKYRICVFSTNANFFLSYLNSPTTSFGHAVVISGTTSYSANDNIYIKDDITLTVDQTITATSIIQGSNATIDWDTTPSSSFTLTATDLWFPAMARLQVGNSTDRIPYAQQAVLNITNIRNSFEWNGMGANEIEIYGEIPAGIHSFVKTRAVSGQKVVEIDDDFSALWTAGDSLAIFAGTSAGIRYDTVASVSGRNVTMTNNLATNHDVGYAVVNLTRATYYGVRFQKSFTTNVNTWYKIKISGVKLDANFSLITNYASGLQYASAGYLAKIEPLLYDNISGALLTVASSTQGLSGVTTSYYAGSVVSNIYNIQTTTTSPRLSISYPVSFTISNVFLGSYATVFTIVGTGHVLSNIHTTTTWGTSGYYNINSSALNATTWTNCKFTSLWMGWTGAGNSWTNCSFDAAGGMYPNGSIVNDRFINCNFGQITANTQDYYPFPYLNQMFFSNCKFSTVPVLESELSGQLAGSYFSADTYGATANDHRNWFPFGKIISTGDGLTDTTAHTSGTGKFAIRFEPLSSTNNLTWSFDVPTGNIQNKTMTVAIWCKINSATYYAGTHQLPRLTIDYDNGTTAYHQAGETTDWQLLFVTFTPTTTYGQITVTLSGKTDATTTNAYIYFDDWTVAYPPSVALDLGGMDNWASALPVVPPIAIPVSAGTVAQNVWQQLSTTSWGTNTMGEKVKKPIKYIDGGEIPL